MDISKQWKKSFAFGTKLGWIRHLERIFDEEITSEAHVEIRLVSILQLSTKLFNKIDLSYNSDNSLQNTRLAFNFFLFIVYVGYTLFELGVLSRSKPNDRQQNSVELMVM